ncbi:MAG: hypothetical protein A2Y94_15275 [Caldithrix sp. RBG_13_44_9]|nr:MAG: hypothetical protein A2Y94_15275 [Caldithrix sp. RBG_13_44_9]
MKIILLITLNAVVALLALCPGQTEYYNSTTGTASVLHDGNIDKIEFNKIGYYQQSQLTGIWKAENITQNTYAQLQFTENGIYQEDIYNQTSNEKLASFAGYYHLNDDILTISFSLDEQYNFSYSLLSPSLLKLYPLSLD